MNRTSVVHAIKQLHELDLIQRDRHGRHSRHRGNNHCNAYLPNWDRFNRVVAEWGTKMRGESAPVEVDIRAGLPFDDQPETVAKTRLGKSRKPDLASRENPTQTNLKNQSNEPKGACGNDGRDGGAPSAQRLMAFKGLLNGRAWPTPRPEPEVVLVGEARKAADNAAMRRWDRDLMALGVEAHAYAIDLITPEIADEATNAERRGRGNGLRLLRERLHLVDLDRGGG